MILLIVNMPLCSMQKKIINFWKSNRYLAIKLKTIKDDYFNFKEKGNKPLLYDSKNNRFSFYDCRSYSYYTEYDQIYLENEKSQYCRVYEREEILKAALNVEEPRISIRRHNYNEKEYKILKDKEQVSSVFEATVFDNLLDPHLKSMINSADTYPSSRYALNKDATLLVVAGPRVVFVAKVEPFEILTVLSKCSAYDPLTVSYKHSHDAKEVQIPEYYYKQAIMNIDGTEIMIISKKDGILKFTLDDIN